MTYYTPVKLAPIYATVRGVLPNQADVSERAPVSGMTREKAIAYARAAYGKDAGVEEDDSRFVEPA